MNAQFSSKKQRLGLLYGVAAGLAFSITAWGVDAFLLMQAHATFPLLKFIPGLLICTLTGGLVGWLTIRIERIWAALFLWALLACLFVWLAVWLPLKFTPIFLKFSLPKISDLLYYPQIDNEIQFKIFGWMVIGFLCLVCGLMEIHLLDQALLTTGTLSLITPLLVSLALFTIAGNSADDLLNRILREPVQIMDNLIQFAADNEGKEISPIVIRQKRLSVVRNLDGLVMRPRKLTLIAFDRTLGQMDILVDFNGRLARCSVIYNQPTLCKFGRIKLDPARYVLR